MNQKLNNKKIYMNFNELKKKKKKKLKKNKNFILYL